MSSFPPYILDTNIFIEPKNRYYSFDICPGFWAFLLADFEKQNILSIKHVYEEIEAGEDDLKDWFKSNLKKSDFFDCISDGDIYKKYLEISEYVTSNYPTNKAADFLKNSSADPWLVAFAAVKGGCIVTNEVSKPGKSKVSIVDICDQFDVHHIGLFEFLRAEHAIFSYQ